MSVPSQPWYVIGHRNPDTDAICAAVGHAAFLRMTGHPEVEAARCGETAAAELGAAARRGAPAG